METETLRTDLWTRLGGAKGRVGGMVRVTWKHTLPYVKYIVNGNLLYDSGNSNQGSVTIYRGGIGREVGGKFKWDGTWVYLADSRRCLAETNAIL